MRCRGLLLTAREGSIERLNCFRSCARKPFPEEGEKHVFRRDKRECGGKNGPPESHKLLQVGCHVDLQAVQARRFVAFEAAQDDERDFLLGHMHKYTRAAGGPERC